MTTTLEKSEWLDDWYVLRPTGICVEGTRAEWLAILDAIEAGETYEGFKRVAYCRASDGSLGFSSPRNSMDNYENRVKKSEIEAFCRQARIALETP